MNSSAIMPTAIQNNIKPAILRTARYLLSSSYIYRMRKTAFEYLPKTFSLQKLRY